MKRLLLCAVAHSEKSFPADLWRFWILKIGRKLTKLQHQ